MEFVVVFLLAIYLLPWVAAESLEHPRAGWVLALVLLLGWTGIGWLAALFWVLRSPRPTRRRARLELVRPQAASPAQALAERLDRRPVWLAGAGIAAVVVCVAAASSVGPPPRVPESGTADLNRPRVQLRMGPAESWPEVGVVLPPCRFEVVQREGAWRHVWRVGECEGRMIGRSGWVRMEDLRPVAHGEY